MHLVFPSNLFIFILSPYSEVAPSPFYVLFMLIIIIIDLTGAFAQQTHSLYLPHSSRYIFLWELFAPFKVLL